MTISPEKIAEMLAALKKADAWMHPTADWVHKSNGYVAAHCARGGPRPLPLYQIDPATLTEILSELLTLRTERDEAHAKWIEADEDAKVQKEFLAVADARALAAEAQLARQEEVLKAIEKMTDTAIGAGHVNIAQPANYTLSEHKDGLILAINSLARSTLSAEDSHG